MYLSFSDYETFGGTMSEGDFSRFSYYAERAIDRRTDNAFKSVTDYPEELKRCVFELTEKIKSDEETGDVSSESQSVGNASQSISYGNKTEADRNKKLARIIETFLYGVQVDGKEVLCLLVE